MTGAAATQVSTLTRPRSSDCEASDWRRTAGLSRAHSAIESQLDVRPSAVRARTATLTTLSPVVTASHDGMSSVAPKPGDAHGEVQLPAW